MKGFNGFKKSGVTLQEPTDPEKQPISLNLSGISNFDLVSPPSSLSTTASNSAESFHHPALEWSEFQVAQWLLERGLGELKACFIEHDINGQVLMELNHSLLKMMNINTLGLRIRIIEAIKDLKREYFAKPRAHDFQKNELQSSHEVLNSNFYKTPPLGTLSAFFKRSKHNVESNPSEPRHPQDHKKTLVSDFGPSPPISPEFASIDSFPMMSFGMVKQNCVRVFGSDGQTRIVNVADAQDAHTILNRVLAKFNISDEPSKYAIFVVSGDSTRSLQDDELVEICNSTNRPEREKFILRKKHLPVNHSEFKKFHAQRLATARGSPRQENQAPGANSKHDKLTKIFGARPPSELITSNLHRFFPVSEEKETESESELLEPLVPDSTQAPRLAAQQDARPRIRTPAWNDSSLLSPSAQTSPLDNQPDIILGKRANGPIQWQQGEFIGAGSHGEVYLGLNSRSAELLAIKRVPLSRILPFDQFNPHGTQQNELKLDALHREVELLRTLEHPNIVRYIDSQVVQSDLVILMEYVPGGSIAALLSTFGPLEETLIRSFVRQILCGLAFLHGRGIIHRDIKGANILVDNKGQAKISDFGLSKQLNDDTAFGTNHRSSFQGSVYWMAPEVVKLSLYTYKADIWGLGCLIVEMLTGIHPFPLFNQIGSYNSPEIPDAISSDCHNFLEWTFKINHLDRPSADELLTHEFVSKSPCP